MNPEIVYLALLELTLTVKPGLKLILQTQVKTPSMRGFSPFSEGDFDVVQKCTPISSHNRYYRFTAKCESERI